MIFGLTKWVRSLGIEAQSDSWLAAQCGQLGRCHRATVHSNQDQAAHSDLDRTSLHAMHE